VTLPIRGNAPDGAGRHPRTGRQARPHRIDPRRRAFAAAAVAMLAVAAGLVLVNLTQTANAAAVGAGSYTETLPAGGSLPTGCGAAGTNPRQYATANAPAGGIPTNDWWSSILFKKTDCAFGEPLYAQPIGYDTFGNGLGFSYNTTPTITGTATGVGEFHFSYRQDFVAGVAGLASPDVKVDGWTDWTVTPYWSDGARTMKATIGKGLPYAYFQVTGGNAQITTAGTPTVWSNSGAVLGYTVNGHDYAAYAPTGATWTVSGGTFTSTLSGKGYFTVAALPTVPSTPAADRTALAATYGQYAHNVVTGTRADYSYNPATSLVTTSYVYTTTAREGTGSGTVAALFPHEWKALTGATPIAQTYVSARGTMKVLTGITRYTTSMKFQGVLPELPAVGDSAGADLTTELNYLLAEQADPQRTGAQDTYWVGKGLGRAARIAEIADQLGSTAVRDSALNAMRTTLTDWLSAPAGKTGHVFYYDRNWGTLIGYPASYGSDQELNDHSFHYGYFIAAAATLAKFNPAWANTSQYGGMIDLLIRDANNYDRNDTRFPYLRDFDIYEGHDWASGHGSFGAGNDEESSSEGQDYANALIQWGQATGNTAVRDAGVYLYTTQAAAIQDYWFDSGNQNFPAAFPHNEVGMVWGDGGAYATWFSAAPEQIQGINMLPITGGSLYLGYNPAYVLTNYNEIVTNKPGQPTVWPDILWQFLALGNGDQALANFRANSTFTSEEGESKAHTFHWIRNAAALGTVDTSVTGNHPLSAVFIKNGARTYVASNITANPLTVTFSNGTVLNLPAGKTVASGANNWSGGSAGGGINPSSSASPSGSASASPSTSPSCPGTAPLLSQGRPAIASSAEGAFTANLAVDGNTATRWSSLFADPQWLQVDLGTSRSIGRVNLSWEAAYGRAYRIETSPDGTNWSPYGTAVTNGDGGTDTITGTGAGRYVRVYATQRATAWGYSLWEFQVYGTVGCTSTSPSTSPSASPSTSPTGGPVLADRYLLSGGGLGAAGAAGSVTLAAANGNRDGTPTNAQVFTATGITGTYSGGATTFDVFADAGAGVGNAVEIRVSYDLTGDGSFDRVETYHYFATDPVAGWEHYTQAQGLGSSSGTLGSLNRGTVKVEVWNALGSNPSTVGLGNQSIVHLPLT
jgi:endoglucanase Acf2